MTVEVDLHIKLSYAVWFWKIPLPKNTTIKSYVQTTFLKYRQWGMGRNFQTQSLTVLMLSETHTFFKTKTLPIKYPLSIFSQIQLKMK
jgi:hypothetical protein